MKKLNKAYKSISEVTEILNLKNKKTGKLSTHTIRFWEKTFKQIKPKVFKNNRRYYDQNNIEILKKIKFLLKDEGLKIEGAKKILNKEDTLNVDDPVEKSINASGNLVKKKLRKISKLIKNIKEMN